MLDDSMRTTITLDEKLVSELVKLSGAKTKTAAVASAVRDQIRRVKLKKLSELLGSIDFDEELVEEADSLDMKRVHRLERGGRKNAKQG